MSTKYKLTITQITTKRSRKGKIAEPDEVLVCYQQFIAQNQISAIVSMTNKAIVFDKPVEKAAPPSYTAVYPEAAGLAGSSDVQDKEK